MTKWTRSAVGSMSGPGTDRPRAVHSVACVIGRISDCRSPVSRRLPIMPPMSFFGVVTKAGFMNKTATVTVSRWVIDAKTGKVRHDQ